ncbi:hypothetical protein GCM10010300_82200 [Streptomyces olivaceoviridis]|nr:hypothetical protein GCM10010300_82200 [Streptomyces olivaceoviridis]
MRADSPHALLAAGLVEHLAGDRETGREQPRAGPAAFMARVLGVRGIRVPPPRASKDRPASFPTVPGGCRVRHRVGKGAGPAGVA